jgi:hypothetical protein
MGIFSASAIFKFGEDFTAYSQITAVNVVEGLVTT